MKKTITMLMAGLALSATAATAQTVKEFPTPMAARAGKAEMHKAPARTPLNVEKELGVKIFGATAYDYDVARHYVQLYSTQPGKLNKLNPVLFPGTSDENSPQLHKINAGAWGGDGYYAYKAAYYAATGSTHLDCWVKVDPNTGQTEILKDLNGTWYPKNWEYIYDLSLNPADGKFYGIAYGTEANEYGAMTSMILEIDKATGANLGIVKKLNDYYFCMAYDYDGKLYAIRWTYNTDGQVTGSQLDVFDQDYNRLKTFTLYVDSEKLKIYFENGLEVDHTTGDLWWSSADLDEKARLIKIDPETGATQNFGTLGYNEMMKGLYIPFKTADSRTAPARVNDLAFTIDAAGNNNVTLTWTNPSTQWNREPLADMSSVKIWRDSYDGEPVATLDASGKAGAAMSWTDANAPRGVHTYYVVPISTSNDKGVMDSLEAYVGRDVPGPVRNLTATATADGKGVVVTWDAPTTGDSNGWFDAESVTYSITRLPDGKKFEGTQTSTTFTDENIPEAKAYSYTVTPISSDGEGTPSTSNQVIAGCSIVPPIAFDFNNKVDADRFTALDLNHDGTRFLWEPNNNTGGKSLRLIHSNDGNDDMLVSPPMMLKKGVTYRVIYHMSFGSYGYADRSINHRLRLMGGTAPTEEAMTKDFQDLNFTTVGAYPSYTIDTYLESPVDGDYYVGLETLTSDENDIWTYIEGFEIMELSDADLSAESLKTYLNLSNIEDNIFKVQVTNHGKEAAKNYKVQIACINYMGEPQVFAETSNVPEIAPKTSAVVEVKGYPERVGEAPIVAIVKMEGDGNASNDMTKPVTVNIDEYYAFNHSVTCDNPVEDPNIPMTHYNNLSVTQTIYTPALTGLPKDGKATIRRLAWEYEGSEEFEGTNIDVYLTETTQNGYSLNQRFNNVYTEPHYSGSFTAKTGFNYLLADLDEEFEYDLTKNLMVTIVKHEAAHNNWLCYFKCIGLPWSDDSNQSVRYGTNNGTTYDVSKLTSLSNTAAKRDTSVPVLHISANIESGVNNVAFDTINTIYWNAQENKVVSLASEFTNVELYNAAGAKVASHKLNSKEAKFNVGKGVYIVKATLSDGTHATLKVFVK